MADMKIPFDTLSYEVRDGANFEMDGELYVHYEESENMDDDGRNVTHVYQRKSDGKFFMVTITYVRYGYEDYGFEDWANDGYFYEVEKVEIVTTEWRSVE